MLKIIRNTYPKYEGVAHGKPGDIVRWTVARGKMSLERISDGKRIFGRDCLPKDIEDMRPMVGIIAQVKCHGWVLEAVNQQSKELYRCDICKKDCGSVGELILHVRKFHPPQQGKEGS